MHIKNNHDDRLLAHKRAVEAERRNKAIARATVQRQATVTPMTRVALACPGFTADRAGA